MKNKTLLLFISAICLTCFQDLLGQSVLPSHNAPFRVSMIKLIANPDFYHGKQVVVQGFAHNQFEDCAIYFSKTHADYLMSFDALWLDFSEKLADSVKLSAYDKKYVSVVGTFNKDRFGHMGSFAGTIENIISIRELENLNTSKKKRK